MEKLARKIIDAIQNSLVGDLVARLVWPAPYLWWQVTDHLTPGGLDWRISAGVFLVTIMGFLAAWVVGAVAETPRRPKKKEFSDHVDVAIWNGFGAWSFPPHKDLSPPVFMRRIVDFLGRSNANPKGVFSIVALAAILVGLFLPLGLMLFPQFFANAHPWLADAGHRLLVAQSCLAIFVASQIRQWATVHKHRLAEQNLTLRPIPTSAA